MAENIKVVFIDTANNSKKHHCYDPDRDRFFEVDSLKELKDYDEIYIDSSIFPNMWSDLRQLIAMGKKVYYFRRPWKWRELRDRYADDLKIRFGKKKTDHGDSYILSKIPRNWKWFRQITYMDIEIKPLLSLEKILYKSYQRLVSAGSIGVGASTEIDEVKENISRIRSEVVRKASEIIPRFDEVAKKLELEDSINGLYSLAGVLVYLGYPEMIIPYHYSLRFLGLYKVRSAGGRRLKHIQGNARRLFLIFAEAVAKKRDDIWPPNYRYQRGLLRELINLLRQVRGPT
ncbi:MAG: hypothetical protein ABDH32_07755 [Candidatus Caldarchaeales archaeon]